MKQDHVTDQAFLGAIDQNYGVPEYGRRLSDKILAALNHAYGVGERDIARQLKSILEEVERKVRGLGIKRQNAALQDAERWTRFVDARDRYRTATADARFDPEEVGEALEEMKEAFRSWSLT
ncbi:MAG TPA: hypothetical protein VI732_02490 [Alphaproteobacteria bacterium]|nr:hypothetical protein [Alphaproteobacteria bacterium]